MRYSDEQLAIIESPDRRLKVVKAYSGCGKSTVLAGYAKKRPKENILYLSFNKSVAEEAKRKFPDNVTCKTMNGLAYQQFGRMFAGRIENKITSAMFVDCMASLEKNEARRIALAHHAMGAFEAFCNSADQEPNMGHITHAALTAIDIAGMDPCKVVEGAVLILKEMLTNTDSPVSHSLYMKLFQLSNPEIPFGTIMVDEAQDLNPVVLDILQKQKAKEIRVGDQHQSIYEFRGSVNALVDGQDADYFWLTQTYRFGQNLADMATDILMAYKGVQKPLIGHGQDVYVDDVETITDEFTKWRSCPFIIQRTKAGIVEALIDHVTGPNPGKVLLPGGSGSYGFDALLDAYMLFAKGESRGVMSGYKSWEQYEEISGLTSCPDASNTMRIVRRYRGMVPKTILSLKNIETSSKKQANLIITTAHKSKGLEHPLVMLGRDFQDSINLKKEGRVMEEQEINLMYVAMTRAEKAIQLSTPFRSLLNTSQYMLRESRTVNA